MDIEDAVETSLFASAIRRFAEARYSLDGLRAGDSAFDPTEWRAAVEAGLIALPAPTRYGGLGGGAAGLALVMKESGRNLLRLPYLEAAGLAPQLLEALGPAGRTTDLLPPILEGETRFALAHREPGAGDDRAYVRTRLRDGRLDGVKSYVSAPFSATQFLVSARDDAGSLRVCLVEAGAPGLRIEPFRLPDSRCAGRVAFSGVRAEILGEGDATAALEAAFDLAAACVSAEAVGAIEALNRDCLEFAKTRRQFGAAIGSFQVMQHRLVDMLIAARTAAAMVDDAVAALDAGAPNAPLLVSAAKVQADQAGRYVGEAAIQIHGGMGMTDESSVGHHHKRLLTIASQYGTAGWHLSRVAEIACSPEAERPQRGAARRTGRQA